MFLFFVKGTLKYTQKMLGNCFAGHRVQFNNLNILFDMTESGQAFLFLWNEFGSELQDNEKKACGS